MIETRHLQPPAFGPRSNPMLFGISEAIAKLCPVVPMPSHLAQSAARAESGPGSAPAKAMCRRVA